MDAFNWISWSPWQWWEKSDWTGYKELGNANFLLLYQFTSLGQVLYVVSVLSIDLSIILKSNNFHFILPGNHDLSIFRFIWWLAGAEKSGKNAEGDSWLETWQEVLHQDEWRLYICYPTFCDLISCWILLVMLWCNITGFYALTKPL